MNTLEAARPNELDACWEIIREGRAFQNEQGFVQWTEDYPNRETLRQDIEEGKGFVLKVDGVIAAYMCVDFDGEPAYAAIEGRWETEEPYAVVHRMASPRRFAGGDWRRIHSRGSSGCACRGGSRASAPIRISPICACSMCWRNAALSGAAWSFSRAAASWPTTSPSRKRRSVPVHQGRKLGG